MSAPVLYTGLAPVKTKDTLFSNSRIHCVYIREGKIRIKIEKNDQYEYCEIYKTNLVKSAMYYLDQDPKNFFNYGEILEKNFPNLKVLNVILHDHIVREDDFEYCDRTSMIYDLFQKNVLDTLPESVEEIYFRTEHITCYQRPLNFSMPPHIKKLNISCGKNINIWKNYLDRIEPHIEHIAVSGYDMTDLILGNLPPLLKEIIVEFHGSSNSYNCDRDIEAKKTYESIMLNKPIGLKYLDISSPADRIRYFY